MKKNGRYIKALWAFLFFAFTLFGTAVVSSASDGGASESVAFDWRAGVAVGVAGAVAITAIIAVVFAKIKARKKYDKSEPVLDIYDELESSYAKSPLVFVNADEPDFVSIEDSIEPRRASGVLSSTMVVESAYRAKSRREGGVGYKKSPALKTDERREPKGRARKNEKNEAAPYSYSAFREGDTVAVSRISDSLLDKSSIHVEEYVPARAQSAVAVESEKMPNADSLFVTTSSVKISEADLAGRRDSAKVSSDAGVTTHVREERMPRSTVVAVSSSAPKSKLVVREDGVSRATAVSAVSRAVDGGVVETTRASSLYTPIPVATETATPKSKLVVREDGVSRATAVAAVSRAADSAEVETTRASSLHTPIPVETESAAPKSKLVVREDGVSRATAVAAVSRVADSAEVETTRASSLYTSIPLATETAVPDSKLIVREESASASEPHSDKMGGVGIVETTSIVANDAPIEPQTAAPALTVRETPVAKATVPRGVKTESVELVDERSDITVAPIPMLTVLRDGEEKCEPESVYAQESENSADKPSEPTEVFEKQNEKATAADDDISIDDIAKTPIENVSDELTEEKPTEEQPTEEQSAEETEPEALAVDEPEPIEESEADTDDTLVAPIVPVPVPLAVEEAEAEPETVEEVAEEPAPETAEEVSAEPVAETVEEVAEQTITEAAEEVSADDSMKIFIEPLAAEIDGDVLRVVPMDDEPTIPVTEPKTPISRRSASAAPDFGVPITALLAPEEPEAEEESAPTVEVNISVDSDSSSDDGAMNGSFVAPILPV